MDHPGRPLDRHFADRLRLAEAYDRLGFYGYHVAEHHSTTLGCAASPGVYLSAMAQRTKRILFGSLVFTLLLYNPHRLIEEVCMLDQMGDGVIDLKRIRKQIEAAGYSGPQEVEILSTEWWKRPGDEVIATCIERYNSAC